MRRRGWLVGFIAGIAVFAVFVAGDLVRSSAAPGATSTDDLAGTSNRSSSRSAQPAVPSSGPITPALRSRAAMFFPAEGLYIGRSADRQVSIAIAVLRGRAAGYLSNGRSLDAWLTGSAIDGMVSLRSTQGDEVVAWLDNNGNTLFGQLSVGSVRHGFDTHPVRPPAALYRGEATIDGQQTVAGWIVLSDGSQIGVGASGDRRVPAPTLQFKGSGTSALFDGTPISARPVTGAAIF